MKNLHISHRIEKPHLLDYSYLIFAFFLPFFDDCHTHWQAIRVQMLPVTKLARNFELALPKFPSLNKTMHSTTSGKYNLYECSLVALPLPAAPVSLRVLMLRNYNATALYCVSILKEPKEDLEFRSLVKSKRLQIPLWGAWVFSIRANLILITIISEQANI